MIHRPPIFQLMFIALTLLRPHPSGYVAFCLGRESDWTDSFIRPFVPKGIMFQMIGGTYEYALDSTTSSAQGLSLPESAAAYLPS